MKIKKFVFSLLLTIICVFVLNSIYFRLLPINLTVKLSGQGCGTITANFSKKAEPDFSSRHRQSKKLCLTDKAQTLNFAFATKKIKNLTISLDGAYDQIEIEQYKISGDQAVDLSSRMIQKKNGTVLTVDLNKSVNIKAGFELNIQILIILLALIFAIVYKGIDYLSAFVERQHKSRLEVVFLGCFFIFLFVPMLYIDDNKMSMEESRRLAVMPKFFKEGGINKNYGQEFDRWFSDHFLGRKAFIGMHNYSLYGLDPYKVREQLLIGKEGWVFSPSHGEIANFQNNNRFSDQELKSIAAYLSAINDWCRRHGKRFYFYIAPSKHRVYPEYYRHVKKIRPDSENGTEQLIHYLQANTDIKVMYPLNILLEHKKDGLMYWKNDTHWSYLGGYWGYVHLMQGMGEEDKILTFDRLIDYKYPTGNISNMYRFLSKDNKTVYRKPDIKKHYKCNPEDPHKVYLTPITCHNPQKEGRVIMFRDSFSAALMDYLAENYAAVSGYWYHKLSAKDVENIKANADIVIFEKIERDLHLLNGLQFNYD